MATIVYVGTQEGVYPTESMNSTLLAIEKHFPIERPNDLNEAIQLVGMVAPAIVVCEDLEAIVDIAAGLTSILQSKKAQLVGVSPSPVDSMTASTLQQMGVSEVIRAVNAKTTEIRLRKLLRQMDADQKVTTKAGSPNTSQISAAQEKVVTTPKAVQERYQVVPALDLAQDVWIMQELPKFTMRKWQVSLKGPPPDQGRFVRTQVGEYELRLDGARPEDPKWIFQGDAPMYDSGAWLFKGTNIQLDCRANGESLGAKLTSQGPLLFLADDSTVAEKYHQQLSAMQAMAGAGATPTDNSDKTISGQKEKSLSEQQTLKGTFTPELDPAPKERPKFKAFEGAHSPEPEVEKKEFESSQPTSAKRPIFNPFGSSAKPKPMPTGSFKTLDDQPPKAWQAKTDNSELNATSSKQPDTTDLQATVITPPPLEADLGPEPEAAELSTSVPAEKPSTAKAMLAKLKELANPGKVTKDPKITTQVLIKFNQVPPPSARGPKERSPVHAGLLSLESITQDGHWRKDRREELVLDSAKEGKKNLKAKDLDTTKLAPLERLRLMLLLGQVQDLLAMERLSPQSLAPLWDFFQTVIPFESVGLFDHQGSIISAAGPSVVLPRTTTARFQRDTFFVQPFFYREHFTGGAYIILKKTTPYAPPAVFALLHSLKALLVARDAGDTAAKPTPPPRWWQRLLRYLRGS